MAVSIPSDLVIGVMRAAPAERASTAAQKLGVTAPSAPEFEVVLGEPRQPAATAHIDLISGVLAAGDPERMSAATASLDGYRTTLANSPQAVAARGLETALIRNLLETMVPQEADGVLGGSFASGIWRSMAVDQMASLYAKAGGLGLSESIIASLGDDPQAFGSIEGARTEGAQWPRFEAERILSYTG